MRTRTPAGRFALCLLISLSLLLTVSINVFAARNIILMIGDGMGLQHVNAGSYYISGSTGNLSFEPYFKCSVTTRSLDSDVTDSSAAATAIATGHKTNNGLVSQSPDGQSFETVLEKAKMLGKSTGLVTTVGISHATPAAFGAHDGARGNYINISSDYLNSSQPDVLFGGGGTASGGSDYITAEQIAAAKNLGYKTIYTEGELSALKPSSAKKALGLFSQGDMTFESERSSATTEPHLSEMAMKAVELLNADPDGFFVMIEGGKIDKGAHANNIKQATGEVVEFNNAVRSVLDWMKGRKDTLLIVTADHETGGLTATGNGKNNLPSTTWTTGGHTAANVGLYVTGADARLVDGYIKNGAIDNTDIYKVMSRSIVLPAPKPAKVSLKIKAK